MVASKNKYQLRFFEQWWSSNYDIILGRGYRLRERYNKRAMDAWLNGDLDEEQARRRGLFDVPDSEFSPARGMDAVRVRDNALVWIKRCRLRDPNDPPESHPELLINAAAQRDDDLKNHCLPLLDWFAEEVETTAEFVEYNYRYVCVVFPWVLQVDRHAWHIAIEAIDFVGQLLEGLVFLHERNIAHRDIHPANIMMAVPDMLCASVDPRSNIILGAEAEDASFKDRIEVPVSYFYIDLGLSTHFAGEDCKVVWRAGLLKLPEVFGTTDPSEDEILNPPQVHYDAFAGDVWQLGTTFRLLFGTTIPSLRPLFRAMTDWDPAKRPTAQQCLVDFRVRVDRVPRWQLLLPVRDASVWADISPWYFKPCFKIRHYSEWLRLAMKARRLGLLKGQPQASSRA